MHILLYIFNNFQPKYFNSITQYNNFITNTIESNILESNSHYYTIINSKLSNSIFLNNNNDNSNNNDNDSNKINLDNEIIEIRIYKRNKGGFDIMDSILSALDVVFEPMAKPFTVMGDVFIFGAKFIFWILKIVYLFIIVVIWLVKDVLIKLPTEFFKTILLIVSSILLAIPQLMFAILRALTNTIGSFITAGFWGWDRIPANNDDYNESNYLQNLRKGNNKDKCYVNSGGKVPFSVLLGTIIAPPIGVFMTLGMTGIIHILIATLLTFAFYFPGLIYALLIIYC